MRKIVTENELNRLAGKLMPLRRNTKIFDGDTFDCCCGKSHIFYTGLTKVTHEGLNGRFLLLCTENEGSAYTVLIKTKMKFGFMYKGLELLGGMKIDE